MLKLVPQFFRNVQDIKCVNVKMTKLESSKTLREKASITTNWALLLDACGLDVSETTIYSDHCMRMPIRQFEDHVDKQFI